MKNVQISCYQVLKICCKAIAQVLNRLLANKTSYRYGLYHKPYYHYRRSAKYERPIWLEMRLLERCWNYNLTDLFERCLQKQCDVEEREYRK